MPVYKVSKGSILFPPPEMAAPNGLLAVGGDLSPERLLEAYSKGIFPWFNPEDIIQWWAPRERFVIFPDRLHISKSMRKMLKTTNLLPKINFNFPKIINNCRIAREGETWLSDEMEAAYTALFNRGNAMCVGIYDESELVGGLYGVVIGKCFFGESMFSKVASGSKLALVHLCRHLTEQDFTFIDCKFHTPHLESMGGIYLSWNEYKRLLNLPRTNLKAKPWDSVPNPANF